MSENSRVRICDIAQELGVSTATVSNVIHGKTKKISDETVKRVQKLLEEREYIPSMAGILLARNDAMIIGVVINNHKKYEGHVLEDPFISSSINELSIEIERAGYFMMIKTTTEYQEIIKFASMWNLTGMVLIGFCEQDYKMLREFMRIPFVVYDGFMNGTERIGNLVIDNYDGGCQVGRYLKELGHKRVLCISDNDICMDLERYNGLRAGLLSDTEEEKMVDLMIIPMRQEEREKMYEKELQNILKYSAIFAVSDFYAIDMMRFLIKNNIEVPKEISIVGFDDTPVCRQTVPGLTTVKQDCALRAKEAMAVLKQLKNGESKGTVKKLPVTLVIRESVAKCTKKKL